MKTIISLKPKRLAMILWLIAIGMLVWFLLLVVLVDHYDASTRDTMLALFNLNAEISIPTWYSQFLLLLAAALLLVITVSAKSDRKYWLVLGLALLYASIDEGAAVHELATVPMREFMQITDGPLYYTWVIPFIVLILIACLVGIGFLRRLPSRTRWLFILSAIIYVGGAIGLEVVGGYIFASAGETGFLYAATTGLEEFLEMSGATLLIYALLDYQQGRSIVMQINN